MFLYVVNVISSNLNCRFSQIFIAGEDLRIVRRIPSAAGTGCDVVDLRLVWTRCAAFGVATRFFQDFSGIIASQHAAVPFPVLPEYVCFLRLCKRFVRSLMRTARFVGISAGVMRWTGISRSAAAVACHDNCGSDGDCGRYFFFVA